MKKQKKQVVIRMEESFYISKSHSVNAGNSSEGSLLSVLLETHNNSFLDQEKQILKKQIFLSPFITNSLKQEKQNDIDVTEFKTKQFKKRTVHRKSRQSIIIPNEIEKLVKTAVHPFQKSAFKDQIQKQIQYFMNDMDTTEKVALGSFFGFMAGDIFGSYMAYQNKNITYYITEALKMNGGGCYRLNPGQTTDQTELVISLSNALIQSQGEYNQQIVLKHYHRWLLSKPFDIQTPLAIAFKHLRTADIDTDDYVALVNQNRTEKDQKMLNQMQNMASALRLLPLVIWGHRLQLRQFEKVIRGTFFQKAQLSLTTSNSLVIQASLVWSIAMKTLIQLGPQKQSKKCITRSDKNSIIMDKFKRQLITELDLEINLTTQTQFSKENQKLLLFYSTPAILGTFKGFLGYVVHALLKVTDIQTNVPMACSMVGALIGIEGIDSYYKHRLLSSKVTQGCRNRPQIYEPRRGVLAVQNLLKIAPLNLRITK